MEKREIQFRAKLIISGKWVYGDLMHIDHATCIGIDKRAGGKMRVFEANKINEQTIGQYTNLRDNNGTKIFEGDILDCRYFENDNGEIEPCKVLWNSDGWDCQTNFDEVTLYTALSYGAVVIGNIHDNPELMDQAEDEEDYFENYNNRERR